MGLLDYADRARNKLKGLLSQMPIVKYARGETPVTIEGLKAGLLATKPFQTDPESMQTAWDAAMNIGPMGLGKIVYHGSPHKFDKFDASKIGTGEGAQAYGHGVYLADSPNVAESYRASNAMASGSPEGYAAGIVGMMGGEDKALAHLKSILPPPGKTTFSGDSHDIISAAITAIEKGFYKNRGAGALYKADLPDEWIPKMLDWDKPVADLTVAEKKALQAAGARFADYWPNTQKVGDVLPKNERAAQSLQKAGIPGIRYLDGGSRGKGQGTYNYVVFPGLEDQVKILERNGVPLTGLLGK